MQKTVSKYPWYFATDYPDLVEVWDTATWQGTFLSGGRNLPIERVQFGATDKGLLVSGIAHGVLWNLEQRQRADVFLGAYATLGGETIHYMAPSSGGGPLELVRRQSGSLVGRYVEMTPPDGQRPATIISDGENVGLVYGGPYGWDLVLGSEGSSTAVVPLAIEPTGGELYWEGNHALLYGLNGVELVVLSDAETLWVREDVGRVGPGQFSIAGSLAVTGRRQCRGFAGPGGGYTRRKERAHALGGAIRSGGCGA